MRDVFFHTIKVNGTEISFSSIISLTGSICLNFTQFVEVYDYFLGQIK